MAEPKSATPAGHHDPYKELAERALAQINRPDYPAGLMPWLAQANLQLYRELTEHLPDEIHRLWVSEARLEQFQGVLNRWLQVHQEASALYRAHGATGVSASS